MGRSTSNCTLYQTFMPKKQLPTSRSILDLTRQRREIIHIGSLLFTFNPRVARSIMRSHPQDAGNDIQ